ncbi:MAG TPA: Ig-like domain-containing protein [Edaphobacter sp.]|nr:Ig-like domain-containing protein [Edaphobacter sp.]
MADYFTTGNSSGSPSNSVIISTPGNGAAVVGAVHLIASASESQAVSQTRVWDNSVKLGVYGTQIDTTYNLAPGNHTTTVIDLNSTFQVIHKSSVNYSVQALVNGLQIISPTPNEMISMSTVHIVAHANESVAISQMQVWDNGVKLGWYPGADVNQYFTLASGSHTVTVADLDKSYNTIHQSSVLYSVQ